MILYKYVSFEAGLKILETSTLGFSHLEDFNDPFEGTGLGFYDLDVSLSVAIHAFRNRFSRKYCILSLTRTALNPLMWSHYADSYKGMVIGIDTEKADFENIDQYVIPAQKGEVRYLKTVPKGVNAANMDNLLSIGNPSLLNWQVNENLLKHGFLYKMQEWAYEEEVRIVKNISSANIGYHDSTQSEFELEGQLWHRAELPTRPIYTTKIPKEAFVDVTLGLSTYQELKHLQERETQQFNPEKVERLEKLFAWIDLMNLPIYRIERDNQDWVLQRKEMMRSSLKNAGGLY